MHRPAKNTPTDINNLLSNPSLLINNPNLNPANGVGASNPFRLDRTQVADGHATRREVLDRRQRAHFDRQGLELSQGGLPLPPAGFRQSQQDFSHVAMLDERRQPLRAIYLEVGNVLTPECGCHIDESDWIVSACAPQRLEELHAGGIPAVMELLKLTHGSITTAAFHEAVQTWIKGARHPRFDRPYTEMVYLPMVELLSHREVYSLA